MKAGRNQGGNTIQVPLWLWTFPYTKHRYVPSARRPGLQATNEKVLFRHVALPLGFSLSPRLSFRSGRAFELATQKRRLSMLPAVKARRAQTWEALGFKFPAQLAVRVHLQRAQKGRFWLVLADGSGPLAYLERRIDFAAGVVEHAIMALVPGRKGKGLSDQAMANAFAVYPALGVERIELTAGLTSGSGVWPRVGFCPKSRQEWDGLRKVIRQNALGLDPAVYAAFDVAHGRPLYVAIARILADDDPEAIFEIVDIDPGSAVKQALGLPHGISGLLLAGGHWRGELDLNGIGGIRLKAFVANRGLGLPSV